MPSLRWQGGRFQGASGMSAKCRPALGAREQKEIVPSPSTLNRETTVLKHIMRRAVVWEISEPTPVP